MARVKFLKSELTVSESNAKNKSLLGVVVSILVLLAISSMIVAAIVIINPEIVDMSAARLGPREAFTLEETMLYELMPMGFAAQWTQTAQKVSSVDGTDQRLDELFYEDSRNINLMTLPPVGWRHPSGRLEATVTALVKNTSLLASVDSSTKLSPSHRYLLISAAKRRATRHSGTARYYLYDIKLDLILMLSTKRVPQQQQQQTTKTPNTDGLTREQSPFHNSFEQLDSAVHYLSGPHSSDARGQQQTRFQAAEWFSSTAGRDSLILIQDNDIYLALDVGAQSNPASQDQGGAQVELIKVTHTGVPNEIFNGISDWLYDEEIMPEAYQMSPKGTTLAYMSFNDSLVDQMPFTHYGPSEQVLPTESLLRYPKVGRVNPRVTVHLVDGLSPSSGGQFDQINLRLPDDLDARQHYIARIKWLTDDHLSIIWLKRQQNEAYVVLCSRQQRWTCEKNLHWATQDGWIELLGDTMYPLDDHHYLLPLLKFEGADVGAFKHIAKVSLHQPNTFSFLTSGRREVVAINGVNAETGIVYYTATVANEPGQRQVYSVHVDLPERDDSTVSCLTCSHYPAECLYNSIRMSMSTQYYIFDCEGPGVPRTELRAIAPPRTPRDTRDANPLPAVSNASLTSSQRGLLFKNPNFVNLPSWTVEAKKWTSFATTTAPDASDLQRVAKDEPANRNSNNNNELDKESGTLLWTIEDNQVLKDKLTYKKAMPHTFRLRVRIADTNYSADVLLMLPPQLGSTMTFRGPTTPDKPQRAGGRAQRSRRSATSAAFGQGLGQEIHAHYTVDTIGEYINQLSSGQQYPMVVDVYAGPNSQRVDFRFNFNLGHYLTSARRTIYCFIDGRGSGFQGTKRMYELYHKFGTVEVQDQIEVAAYLARNYSFIDPSKVAIWGWSYGGYASAMALAQSNAARLALRHQQQQPFSGIKSNSTTTTTSAAANGRPLILSQSSLLSSSPSPASGDFAFECAVSVAPVTHWIYYDTAYTERYMSSPYTNELYDELAPGDHKSQEALAAPLALTAAAQQPATNKWVPSSQHVGASYRVPFADFWSARSGASQPSRAANRMDPLDLNDRYKSASLLERIGDIDRKRFLLIHGTADDNVHFQQSIMLMKRLIQKNIMFETRLYPDQDHDIRDRADKLHLSTTLSNFFAECFDMAY